MSEDVRYIHTQKQAQAELERRRRLAREQYARKRQRHAAADERTSQRRKQKCIQYHLLYIGIITNVDTMAITCQEQKDQNLERSAEKRVNLFEKIRQRYSLIICHH